MAAKMVLPGFLFGLIIILSVSNAAAIDNPDEFKIPEKIPDIPYDRKTSELIAQSVMNFAHNLALALDTNSYPNTQIFSPLSVMSVLSILQMGSNGNTYKQLNQLFALLNADNNLSSSNIHEEFGWLLEDVMLNTRNSRKPQRSRISKEWRSKPYYGPNLMFGGKNDLDDETIRVSNALFIQNGFSLKPDYAYAAQSVYKSEVTPLDFRHQLKFSEDYINSWVNQNTLGKIPFLFENDLVSSTNMIVASTLYFRGFWEHAFFDANAEIKQAFYPDGPSSIPVGITLMHSGGAYPFYQSDEFNCRIIGLPYKGNQTTMYVIQPNDSTRLNLQALQKNLTGEVINELISKMEYKSATISFPKFHVESKMELKKPLKRMGFEDIFTSGQADFSLIADPEQNTEKAIAFSSSPDSLWAARIVPVPHTQLDIASQAKSQPLNSELIDRFGDAPLIFSRIDDIDGNETSATNGPLSAGKDENKTSEIALESSSGLPSSEKPSRKRRHHIEAIPTSDAAKSLEILDQMRSTPGLKKPNLCIDEIVHKIDFNVNEQGTEAAAVTVGSLRKSGPEVNMRCDTPFLIIIRHDPTKLPLFYGIVNIPVS